MYRQSHGDRERLCEQQGNFNKQADGKAKVNKR